MNYDLVQNYAMKCRLYPNKSQKQAIDDALTAVRVFHNCLVYDMWNNHINVKEKPAKKKDAETSGEMIHFPDISSALKADYKAALTKEHPIIDKCPAGALTTNVGLKADLIKEFDKKPIEYQKPRYYNELHPRRSYTYQEKLSKIHFSKNDDDTTPLVFRIDLAKIGCVKVRGWNRKLRFGENHSSDFLQWVAANPQTVMTVTVSKDPADDYFIVFKLQECWKPFLASNEARVGIDVGVKDIAICSDGQKFENKKFKQKEKRHQRHLNRKLARRWGPCNEEYREERKKRKAEWKKYQVDPNAWIGPPPEQVVPSKRYAKIRISHARLNRSITRKRDQWNHKISRAIVENNSFIGVETLNISGMVRNKHLSFALTDAAFGTLLSYINYKAIWHGRTVQSIDKWTPSSKRCSACGYVYESTAENGLKPWSLAIRKWTCPICGSNHDRDVNAAQNILYFALSASDQT